MFNSIQGIITEKFNDVVRLLTGGVEWEFIMPSSDVNELPSVGKEGRVFTWLYHKENEMRLFAFSDEKRRGTFLELLKVDGIGPKGAVKIMGGISQDSLELALENEDVARLESVPGLGKKTAQKMILALKGKLSMVSSSQESSMPYGELVTALTEMGYDRKATIEAIRKAEENLAPNMSSAEKEKILFKQAIVHLTTH